MSRLRRAALTTVMAEPPFPQSQSPSTASSSVCLFYTSEATCRKKKLWPSHITKENGSKSPGSAFVKGNIYSHVA